MEVAHIFISKVGENIRMKRISLNMSLEELGLQIGLTRMQVHRIEKGYNITLISLLKLSIALKVSPSELVKVDYIFSVEDLT